MTAPLDLDAVRVRAPYTHFAGTILALCDELEATRAERDRLREAIHLANKRRKTDYRLGWEDALEAVDALDGVE